MFTPKISKIALALLAAAGLPTAAHAAGIFVSTGHTGAQVQCDVEHTQHWTYGVTQTIAGIDGALLTMKRGSTTFETITFSIFEGDFSAFGTATPLLSVT